MTQRSYFRGHPIEWTGDVITGKWVYADTKEDIPATNGEERSCFKCGIHSEMHESDKCLGNLPGVTQACCGHGVPSEAYVVFSNGVVLRNFSVDEPLKQTLVIEEPGEE